MVKQRIPQKITKKIISFINLLKKDNFSVERAILFGSWAKGKAKDDSDIDLCIVSSDFEKKDPWEYLWNKRLENNNYSIQPIGYSPKDFRNESPLVWEIKNTGIKIIN